MLDTCFDRILSQFSETKRVKNSTHILSIDALNLKSHLGSAFPEPEHTGSSFDKQRKPDYIRNVVYKINCYTSAFSCVN